MDKILGKVISGQHDKKYKISGYEETTFKYDFSDRIHGDHYIFSKENVFEIINLQPLKSGKAKQYQVQQVINLVLKYKFHLNEV